MPLLSSPLLLSGCSATPPPPQRIIFLSMDTVRADHVNGYGPRDTTPELAKIAAEGVLFRDFYGASTYTSPSHMSIFTGLDPREHGVASIVARLSPDVPTLAEILSEAGFRTVAFHEGGFVSAHFGFDRGFDSYDEYPRGSVVGEALPEVLDWIRSAGDDPYFLFVHTYAAHRPYGGLERYRAANPNRGLPSDTELALLRETFPGNDMDLPDSKRSFYYVVNSLVERGEEQIAGVPRARSFTADPHFEADIAAVRASYDERIRRIDRAIGRIKDTLIEGGQWEDTLFVIFSDHGEAFFEHGLDRHGYVPFNEVLKVPLVISYPRFLRNRSEHVVEGLVWHLDLLPTVLGLAGLPTPPGGQGTDLTPILAGDAELPEARAIYPAVLSGAPYRAPLPVRRVALMGGYKRIEGHAHYGDTEGYLFELESDPGEERNLRETRRELFDAMAGRLRLYLSGLTIHPPVHRRTGRVITGREAAGQLDREELQKLRNLGYVE
ncbi:MAG: sulfatase [Myxococcota bacterium]